MTAHISNTETNQDPNISMATDPDKKRLIVLRHGKAAYPPVPDHERPLAARGNNEAPAAGRWLAEHGLYPDVIVTSDAVRTRQTTTWVLSELGEKAPTPYLDSRLYHASASQALSVINETEEQVRTLMVVGHMPWVQELGMRLASVRSDEKAVIDMAERYPTLGMMVFDIPGQWASLDGRDADMTDFIVPR